MIMISFGIILIVLTVLFQFSRFALNKPLPVRISFIIAGKREVSMNLQVSKQLSIGGVVPEDKFDNPTGPLDAPPTFSVTDPTLGSVVAAADGLSVVFTPSGKLGSCQVQALGQAGGKVINGSLDLVLIPGDATHIVLQAGIPVDPPAPQPPPAA